MQLETRSGLSGQRLGRLRASIEQDVAKGLYHGAVICVARHGDVGLLEAVGCADPEQRVPLRTDCVFSLFSLTKAFTNIAALAAVERGQLALTGKVVDVIPEFKGVPRDRATLFHLLTHTTGMPGVWTPKMDMFEDRLDELVQAVCANVHGSVEPGSRCDYSPVANHVLMAEMLRRTDPAQRSFRQILDEDLFLPLAMKDTSFGVRPDLRERKVVPDTRGIIPIRVRGRTLEGPYSLFEEPVNEAAHVGACSTVVDLLRFAEMLRRAGELDGTRVLAPRTLGLARRNWTGEMYNEIYKAQALRAGWEPPPAYIGLGFSLRGERMVHHQFGTLASPETFGNYGAGSTMLWVEPELDLTFVCLTAGLLAQASNIERFQRLSDLAIAAAT